MSNLFAYTKFSNKVKVQLLSRHWLFILFLQVVFALILLMILFFTFENIGQFYLNQASLIKQKNGQVLVGNVFWRTVIIYLLLFSFIQIINSYRLLIIFQAKEKNLNFKRIDLNTFANLHYMKESIINSFFNTLIFVFSLPLFLIPFFIYWIFSLLSPLFIFKGSSAIQAISQSFYQLKSQWKKTLFISLMLICLHTFLWSLIFLLSQWIIAWDLRSLFLSILGYFLISDLIYEWWLKKIIAIVGKDFHLKKNKIILPKKFIWLMITSTILTLIGLIIFQKALAGINKNSFLNQTLLEEIFLNEKSEELLELEESLRLQTEKKLTPNQQKELDNLINELAKQYESSSGPTIIEEATNSGFLGN